MTNLLFNVIWGAVVASASFIAGWWLHGDGESAGLESDEPNVAIDKSKDKQVAQETLVQVHDVAVSMAASVGAHSTKIRSISEKLNMCPSSSATDVELAVAELVVANEQMEFQLQAAEGRLKEQAAVIECNALEARTDVLTQLPNRRAFDAELTKRYEKLKTEGEVSSVLMIDIDFFKRFNDEHGHQCGDAVLQAVARSLQDTLRKADTVSRYGGEEFAVILPRTEIGAAKKQAERIRRVIEATEATFDCLKLHVTASVGIAQMLPGEDASLAVRRADDALYGSKGAGRNCSSWHDGVKSIRIEPEKAPLERREAKTSTGDTTPENDALSHRDEFLNEVRRLAIGWRQGGSEFSILLMKVDEIKEGDGQARVTATNASLQAAAQFLKTVMGDDDCGAFYSNDSLALLLSAKTAAQATEMAERLRAAINRFQVTSGGTKFSFTVTIGIAGVEQTDEDCDSTIDRVEAVVAEAVLHGSDQIVIAPPQLSELVAADSQK